MGCGRRTGRGRTVARRRARLCAQGHRHAHASAQDPRFEREDRGGGGHPEIFEKVRRDNAKKFRGFEAWQSALRAVQVAVDLPFDEGMKLERQAFLDLIPTEQSRAQRYMFFAERKVWKIADVPEDIPVLPIRKVGVIGAGTMGGGNRRGRAGCAGTRRRHDPAQLRQYGQEGSDGRSRRGGAHAAA